MKKLVVGMVMVLVGMLMFTGCQSVSSSNTESLASAAGAGAVMAYNSLGGSMLSNDQKKIANQVIDVFASIGESVNEQTINDLPNVINMQLEKNIKDAQQLKMAKSFASAMLTVANPYLKNQTGKNSILIFASFCRGMSLSKVK